MCRLGLPLVCEADLSGCRLGIEEEEAHQFILLALVLQIVGVDLKENLLHSDLLYRFPHAITRCGQKEPGREKVTYMLDSGGEELYSIFVPVASTFHI